jgi:melatonin receptor type 1B
MPLSFATLIQGKWIFGDGFCQAHGFCVFTLGLASLHMMALVSVNRYFCILKPGKYQRLFKKGRTILFILMVWVNAFIGSIPPLFFNLGGYSFQPGKAMCLYEFDKNLSYTVFIEVVFIGTPLCIIALCYSFVFKEVYFRNKVFAPDQLNTEELRAHVKEAKITKTLAAVFLGFACCWLPVSVIDYIDAINGSPLLPRRSYLTYGFLVYVSSLINPMIYGIASRSFRHEYKRMVKSVLCSKSCIKSAFQPGNSASNVETTKTYMCFYCSIQDIFTALYIDNAPLDWNIRISYPMYIYIYI